MSSRIPWTSFDDKRLRQLAPNHTAFEISEQMPERSRNSIIGRCSRLGIKLGRASNAFIHNFKMESGRSRNRIIDASVNGAKPVLHFDSVTPTKRSGDGRGLIGDSLWAGEGISLMQAGFGNCRWPYEGTALDGNPKCCGEPSGANSLCPKHDAIAHIGGKGRAAILRKGS
jgi:hypothetical protein